MWIKKQRFSSRISTNSGVKTKKIKKIKIKVFFSKNVRISTISGVEPRKKGSYYKISEKTILANEFCGTNQYFERLRSRAALQWHRACYFLSSTILARGKTILVWEGTAPECLPRGARPGKVLFLVFAYRRKNTIY